VIQLTRFNNSELWLNPLLIESVEPTPDTIVTLAHGHKYVVRETPQEVAAQIMTFMKQIGLVGSRIRKEDEV